MNTITLKEYKIPVSWIISLTFLFNVTQIHIIKIILAFPIKYLPIFVENILEKPKIKA